MLPPEFGVVAGFVVLVLFAWSPLLGVERVRALFAWPTRWFALNYLLVGTGVVLAQCLSYLAVIFLIAGTDMVTGGDAAGIVGGVIASNLLLPGSGALAAVWRLPDKGYWSPAGDGLDGRIALAVGVVWYAVITSVAFLLISLVVLFANLPT